MNRRFFTTVLALTIGGSCCISLAQSPGAQPSTQPVRERLRERLRERIEFSAGPRGYRMRELGRHGQLTEDGVPPRPTPEEMAEIKEFMLANMPNRWQAFQRLLDEGANEFMILRYEAAMADRYAWFMDMQARNPDLYEAALAQAKAEDEVRGAAAAAREATNHEEAAKVLRQKVEALVKLTLDERERRIRNLEEVLRHETDRLAEDRENIQGLIDNQVERMLDDPRMDGWDRRFGRDGERRSRRDRQIPAGEENSQPQEPEPTDGE